MVQFSLGPSEQQKNLESYLNLSRRELQVLCKNNNLPANRSHTQLAKSLTSFFEKNAGPSPLKEKPTGLVLDTRPKGSESLSEDMIKVFVGEHERAYFLEFGSNKIPPHVKGEKGDDRQHSSTGNLMTISSHMDHQASKNAYNTVANAFCPNNLAPKLLDCPTSKAGNNGPGPFVAANIQQIQKDTLFGSKWHQSGTLNESNKYSDGRNKGHMVWNHAASGSETYNSVPTILPKVAKGLAEGSLGEISTKGTPSFEFFVMSEEGINLYVDLNSSPSEWITSLKDEVSNNLTTQDSKSKILSNHTENLSEEADAHLRVLPFENIGRNHNSDRVDRSSGCTTSTLSSDSENCQTVAPQSDPTFASSDSSALTSSSIPVELPRYLDGNQVIPSCATPLTDEKHFAFDATSCPGDASAFSEDLLDASSGIAKGISSVPCIHMGPINDMGVSGPEGTGNPDQMECLGQKIHDDSNFIEIDRFGDSLASIPEESNLLKSEKVVLTSDVGNFVKDNYVCEVLIEEGPKIGPAEIAADCERSLNFCELGGHLVHDCSVAEARSNLTSEDYIHNPHTCNLKKSNGKDPVSVLNHELGKSTQTEEKETSECLRSQKFPANNSKRSHSPEFQEELHRKRHHPDVENKSGTTVNLRSTRTSAKEANRKQVVRRRSSRQSHPLDCSF